MSIEYVFREFNQTQQETLARAIQAHQAYLNALKASRPLKGGMHWKTIKGREYLYKYRDRLGHGDSLGPRSPETERLLDEYARQRQELTSRLRHRRHQLSEVVRFCRAALLQRVPVAVIKILRRLEQADLPGAPLIMVIGTPAIHALEFATGVFIDTAKDAPFWQDAAQRLTLATAAPVAASDLLRLVRQGDRSFQPLPGDANVVINRHGFLVRLVRPGAVRPSGKPLGQATSGPTVPAELGDLAALVGSPKFSQIVIGKDGTPATMVVPDPRALALHNLWLSQQPDRPQAQKWRVRIQAMALAELILRYLPQYYFFSSQLHLFPGEVIHHAEGLAEGYESGADLDLY
jgi:hypothetical protein